MNHLLIFAAAAFGSSVVVIAATGRKTSRLHNKSWDELVGELLPLDSSAIQFIANEHLNPVRGQIGVEPYQMWQLIGGLDGMWRMRHNAEIICALAAYAERWNYEEAVIVTERIRFEAQTIRREVARACRYGTVNPLEHVRAPFHVFEAAAAYHLMRTRLLALYETSHAGLYPRLIEAL